MVKFARRGIADGVTDCPMAAADTSTKAARFEMSRSFWPRPETGRCNRESLIFRSARYVIVLLTLAFGGFNVLKRRAKCSLRVLVPFRKISGILTLASIEDTD
jgi:hypothetical protein